MIAAAHVVGEWLGWAGFDGFPWAVAAAVLWYQAFLLGPAFLVVMTILSIRRARTGGARWRALAAWAALAGAGVAAIWCGAGYVKDGLMARPPVIQAGPGPDAVALSPDGRTLYAADGGSYDSGGVTPVSLLTGRAGNRIEVGAPVGQLVLTPDGRTLYALAWVPGNVTGELDQLTPIDLATGRAEDPVRFPYGAVAVVVSPDGRDAYVLADTGSRSAAVIAVSTATGREGRAFPVPAGSQALAISPDGRTLYVGAQDPADDRGGEVIPLDAGSGAAGAPVSLPAMVTALAFSPDGRTLYATGDGSDDGGNCTSSWPCSLSAIDVATGTAGKPAGLGSEPVALAVAPDGRVVYVLGADETITPVNALTGEPGGVIRTGDAGNPMDSGLVIAPDGRAIYVADQDQGVAVIRVSG
jgi:DNA-binding beta-propeller fold protein YncE